MFWVTIFPLLLCTSVGCIAVMSTLALDVDLLLQPWMPVRLGGIQLLAKSYFGDTKYQVLLSNMQCVWEEEVDADTIKERAQVKTGMCSGCGAL